MFMIPKQNKLKIIIEVLIVFTASIGTMWLTSELEAFKTWQKETFGQPVLSVLLSTFWVPMAAIALTNLNANGQLKLFKPAKLRIAFRSAGRALIVMLPVTILSFPVIQIRGYSYMSWTGGAIIAGWHLVAIPLLMLIFSKRAEVQEEPFSQKDSIWILMVPVCSAILILGLNQVHPKVAGVVISLVFIGLAEEFKYRGYIQHRLNTAYGKPFDILNMQFGWGLVLASLLFSLAHVISPGNPMHWAWGMWTFFAGMCLGIIREKGGSFLASTLVHGFIMIFPVIFS